MANQNNQNIDYKQLIQKEYIRCAKDPLYFFKNYVYISHPQRGKIKFNTYRFQELAFQQLLEYDYNIILKARQMGISTLTSAYALWMMLFHSNKSVLCIATKQDVAKNLVSKVRYAHENLPKWMQEDTLEDNKLSLRFGNGSEIKAISSSPDAGRSESISLLILDEAAFIEHIKKIWGASQQTLATGGQCIALSTPNGMGNWFHKTWLGAKEGTNKFNPINLHWSLHPERDQKWRDAQDDILGPDMAAQECDCDFLSSGNSVVPGVVLQWYKENKIKKPIEKRGFDQNYWIWEYPDYTLDYIITVDVARGDGKDYSAFHIMEVESMRQCASYRGQMDTKQFGRFLCQVGREWNDALVVVENANVGWAVLQEMIDMDYPEIFYSSKDMQVVDTHYQYVDKKEYDYEKKLKPGFTTSRKTRPMLISKLDEYVRKKEVDIKDERLIDELFTFIWTGVRAEAMSGYNDDMVMSYCIALWVRDTALRLRHENIEQTRQSLSHITKIGGVYTNDDVNQDDPYTTYINGEEVNLRWLFDS